MKHPFLLLASLMLFLQTSCSDDTATSTSETGANTETIDFAKVPDSWITERVAAAKTRLQTSEAGQVVWKAMEAHGGLEKWYANGPLSFRFNYQPLDGSVQRDSYEKVDTWRNRTRHEDPNDRTAQYGTDGSNFWELADSAHFAYNTRFWSLTPYYFSAQPFVLDGSGVNLEKLPNKTYKEEEYELIKVTFDSGTGDAPDDYYVLYFGAQNNQLKVIRYIVSYPGYFEKGKHLPEKFMELYGSKTVGGILFPTSYQTHWLTETEEPGEYITKIDLTDVAFEPELKSSYFDIPEGAKVFSDY